MARWKLKTFEQEHRDMERMMTRIQSGELPYPEFIRASGDVICECGLPYRKHGTDSDYPDLVRVCNGTLIHT